MSEYTQEISSPMNNLTNRKENLKSSASENRKVQEFNVDQLSYEDLKESLSRVREQSVEPFAFLNNITDDVEESRIVPTDTDIDIQLSALAQRIQLNKSLLEKTNHRIKRINSHEEVSGIDQIVDFTLPPGLNQVNEALKETLSTLTKVKEIISKNSKILH